MSDHNAQVAPDSSAGVAERLVVEGQLARRVTRLCARWVDGIIYMVGWIPVVLLERKGEDVDPAVAMVLLFMGAILAVNLYILSVDGQTLGKKALKVRIVRTNGERASLGRIFGLRMVFPLVMSCIPYTGRVFVFANVLFILRADRRCIHDHLADTKVVMA